MSQIRRYETGSVVPYILMTDTTPQCPVLANNRHWTHGPQCPFHPQLRTLRWPPLTSAFDPERTLEPDLLSNFLRLLIRSKERSEQGGNHQQEDLADHRRLPVWGGTLRGERRADLGRQLPLPHVPAGTRRPVRHIHRVQRGPDRGVAVHQGRADVLPIIGLARTRVLRRLRQPAGNPRRTGTQQRTDRHPRPS
jgi:hypothetical protein